MKSKPLYGWKVCSVIGGKHFSALNLGKITQYFTTKYNARISNCGPMAVFTDKSNAKDFYRTESNSPNFAKVGCLKIFECKYFRSKDFGLWSVENNWMWGVPRGTDFADRVMLIKKCR